MLIKGEILVLFLSGVLLLPYTYTGTFSPQNLARNDKAGITLYASFQQLLFNTPRKHERIKAAYHEVLITMLTDDQIWKTNENLIIHETPTNMYHVTP